MSIFSQIPYVEEDSRIRRFILPRAVVSTSGNVSEPQNLLVKKHLQIGFGEKSVTVLQNGNDGENASVVLDFGIELHGGLRIINFKSSGLVSNYYSDYPKVRLTFGESVSEANSALGQQNATNDHSVRCMEVTVPNLSDQEWGQTGFRFVKIELLTPDATLEIKSLLAVSVMNDFTYIGSFECDDEKINLIYDTAAYTCHLCLQNMIWDGIKRDRLVWIGDMMPETMTVRSVFGALPIVEKSLDFSRETTELPRWMNDIPAYSMWWICILRDWYMASGNRDFLERQMEYLKRLLLQLCDRVQPDGTVQFSEWNILDWPTNRNPHFMNGVYSLMKMALYDGAFLLREFGEELPAKQCEETAKNILITEETDGAKQVAAFMALADAMDLDKAADQITENGDSSYSTFLSYFILKTLSLAGRDDAAISSMRSYYGHMLDKGATSFWEDFQSEWAEESGSITDLENNDKKNIHADYGRFCYVGHRHSFCHGWSSGPVPFLTERVLGVNIVEPGCKTLKIEPHLGTLKWVKGTFPTPYGVVSIQHQLDDNGNVISEITAPDEIRIIK